MEKTIIDKSLLVHIPVEKRKIHYILKRYLMRNSKTQSIFRIVKNFDIRLFK